MSDSTITYILLGIGAVILFRWSKKLSRSSITTSIIGYLISFILLLIGVFHWRLNYSLPSATTDVWLNALDISMAHAVVTAPIVFGVFFVFSKFIDWIKNGLIGTLINAFILMTISTDRDNFFLRLLPTLIAIIATYFLTRLLLVDSIDLQQALFGNYDMSLGWQYPTIFKFTILSEHIQLVVQSLVAKKEIAAILSFLAFGLAPILGFNALVKGLDDLLEKLSGKNK